MNDLWYRDTLVVIKFWFACLLSGTAVGVVLGALWSWRLV